MSLTKLFRKGAFAMPEENDSPWLLHPHKRGLQNLDRMRRYGKQDAVDLVVVGAGAGGVTLAQRLARAGWRIVILETGPFWDPDRDWVSDEKGSGHLYWTDTRVIGGNDPIEMGKNNSGVGVGGSMTHFAGYTPRFHPSDFEVRTRDGVAFDWPISYWDLKESFERLELELPVAGQDWPWGDPHSYPHGPHPIAGAASVAWQGALGCGIEMRVGPVSITNGVFGNRPHCIYRGFCLQGCKVNAKASPLITHLPDAIEHGVEVRADSMVVRVEIEESSGRCTGVWGQALRAYMRDYNHWAVLGVLCELLPQAENRVTLAGEVDGHGMPIARFDHSLCENDKKNIAFATKIMEEIWEGAEAQDTLKIDRYAHLVGGCRMGFAPDDSVVDSTHRAWEVPNLFVCDGSVLPTQGSANPALAIMALADRLGGLLGSKRTSRRTAVGAAASR